MEERKKIISYSNRLQIPAFYLRKAWFIILEDVLRHPGTYREGLKDQAYDKFAELGDLRGSVIKLNVTQKSFPENGLEYTNYKTPLHQAGEKKYSISYTNAYQLGRGSIPVICLAIAFAVNARLKKKVIPVPAGKKEAAKFKSAIQLQFHRFLSEGNEDDGIIHFSETVIPVGFKMAEGILLYATYISKRNKKEADVKVLGYLKDELKKYFEDHRKNRDDPRAKAQSAPYRHSRFWASPKAEYMLGDNAFWLQYERIDYPEGTQNFGLSVSAVVFQETGDGQLMCSFFKLNHYNQKRYLRVVSNGLATIDAGNWLHVELHNQRVTTQPAVSKLTMRLGDIDSQEILIGHYNFYAVSRMRYLCKTVVWYKPERDVQAAAAIFKPDGTLDEDHIFQKYVNVIDSHSATRFTAVPKQIRSFLEDRSLNRLTMPSEPLTMLEGTNKFSLDKWLKDQTRELAEDMFLENCAGQYFVVYHHGKVLNRAGVTAAEVEALSEKEMLDDTRFDTLSIIYDEIKKSFSASFHHYIDTVDVYNGAVTRKKTSVEILLSDTDRASVRSGQRNLILLTFSIPEDDRFARFKDDFDNRDYFQGLISGLTDREYRSVAFKALIMKREALIGDQDILDKEKIDEGLKSELIRFFTERAGNLAVYGS